MNNLNILAQDGNFLFMDLEGVLTELAMLNFREGVLRELVTLNFQEGAALVWMEKESSAAMVAHSTREMEFRGLERATVRG